MTTKAQQIATEKDHAMSESIITIDPRLDAIKRSFLWIHPRVPEADLTITAVEQGYKVDVGEVCYVGTFLSPRTCAFTQVDPRDLDVRLAPAQPVAIPLLPEPVAPAAALGLDPQVESRRVRAALDGVRHLAEQARVLLRGVADTEVEEIERLRGVAPLDAVNVAGQMLSPDIPLQQLAQQANEARRVVRALGDTLTEAQALVADLRPRLRRAVLDATAAQAPGLRGLAALDSVGEIQHQRVTAHVEWLDAVEDLIEKLVRASAEIQPLLHLFEQAVRIHVRACLLVTREVGLAVRLQRVAQVKALLTQTHQPFAVETLAEQACADLDVTDLPVLRWPSNAEAPTLQ